MTINAMILILVPEWYQRTLTVCRFFTKVMSRCPGYKYLQCVFRPFQFFPPINLRVKKSEYFQPSSISLIMHPNTFPLKDWSNFHNAMFLKKHQVIKRSNAILFCGCLSNHHWRVMTRLCRHVTHSWDEPCLTADVTHHSSLITDVTLYWNLTWVMIYSRRHSWLIP